MRVLFTVFAAKPHLYNLVPLAWALEAAGHEVRVASQPDLTEAITRTGLTAVPVGEALQLADSFQAPAADGERDTAGGGGGWRRLSGVTETRPEKLTWNYVLGTLTIGCSMEYEHVAGQSMTDDLVEFAGAWRPDLVIWDALTLAGPVAALSCGAAHARMLFGLDYNSAMLDTYFRLLGEQPAERRDDPLSDYLSGRLSRYGMDFDPAMARELMTGQWTIDPTPPWMQLPVKVPLVPVRYVPYNGPSSLPGWIHHEPGRPRVCLSLGMSGRELLGGDRVSGTGAAASDPTVLDMAEALAGLDAEIVVTLKSGQLSEGHRLPDNVHAVDFVPLDALLPTCGAVIHHGGFGTVGNVLTHGVPSLTIPAPWWDETALGEHLATRGAGLLTLPQELTLDGLCADVARLLAEPSFLAAAREVREDQLAVPSPSQAVPELERRAAGHRSVARGAHSSSAASRRSAFRR
ncbi:activator-dependent family glycosyltransferase [Streptomyces tendae]|uniref:activator-dependent family glycosyltransferase n=1 Tax=Streptomyces tendae TaxID=1932 RepID=UPI0037108CF5